MNPEEARGLLQVEAPAPSLSKGRPWLLKGRKGHFCRVEDSGGSRVSRFLSTSTPSQGPRSPLLPNQSANFGISGFVRVENSAFFEVLLFL